MQTEKHIFLQPFNQEKDTLNPSLLCLCCTTTTTTTTEKEYIFRLAKKKK